MMRTGYVVGSVLLSWHVVVFAADESPRVRHAASTVDPTVQAILQKARETLLKQEMHQQYWIETVLLQVGEVQIRAGDFEGALLSISGSDYDYGRNGKLIKLAEVLAGAGSMDRASDVLRLLGTDHGWRQENIEDGVQLRWIDYLIGAGNLAPALTAIDRLKCEPSRSEGHRKLAVAYAKAGDSAHASEQFELSSRDASKASDEFERLRALCEIANAQLAVGFCEPARVTARQLAEMDFRDALAKVAALRESAVIFATTGDRLAAHQLFKGAIEAQKALNKLNESVALEQIAVSQAAAGYIDDARRTVSTIKECGLRGEGRAAVAEAQLKAGDVDSAIRAVLAIDEHVQYRDDALEKIVNCQIAKRACTPALTTAERIDNPSRKATAILKVATAYAQKGDHETAADIAAGIKLAREWRFVDFLGRERFDYRYPSTWGFHYEADAGFTSLRMWSDKLAVDLAGAAMKFAQAQGLGNKQSYAVQFANNNAQVTRALARAHAASGDSGEALDWAEQIGSSDKIRSVDDDEVRRAVEQRVSALVGVAEGILDRTGAVPSKLHP